MWCKNSSVVKITLLYCLTHIIHLFKKRTQFTHNLLFLKSKSVAIMPAKKTTTKRKSAAIVEDDKDSKKVKGKSLPFSKQEFIEG